MMSFQIKIFLGLFIGLRCHGLIQNDNNSCPLSLFNLITDERVERLLKQAELLEKIRNLEAELNTLAGKPSIEEKRVEKENNSCQSTLVSLSRLINEERVERRLGQAELLEKNRILEAKLNNLTSKPSIGGPQIAFSGMLSKKIPRSEWGQIVKFDVVTTNIGDSYSISTGKFRCPVAGLYLFSCSILGDSSSQAILEMYQNGVKIARPYSGFGTHGTQSGTDITVVHAAVGDEVYSKVTAGGAATVDHFTRFTAVLITSD